MYPSSSAKIIAPRPRANKRILCTVFVLGSLWMSGISPARADGPFEQGSFSQIDFSENCVKKQWTLAPDNSLELLLAPPTHGVCEAFLHFYNPQDVTDVGAIAFEARSTQPGPFLKVGLQETPDSRVVF